MEGLRYKRILNQKAAQPADLIDEDQEDRSTRYRYSVQQTPGRYRQIAGLWLQRRSYAVRV